MAAGLTLKKENFDRLKADLNAYLDERYGEKEFLQTQAYDTELDFADINSKLIEELNLLEPFGQANPRPKFRVSGTAVQNSYLVGKQEKVHLKMQLKQSGKTVDAIHFFFKDRHQYMSGKNEFLARLEINDFNNKPQLMIESVNPVYTADDIKPYTESHFCGCGQRLCERNHSHI